MQYTVERLLALYERIRPVLLKCELAKSTAAYKRADIDEAKPEDLKRSIQFLESFIEIRVAEYESARKEVPEEQWERYKIMQIEGLWEQENLAAKQEALIKDWRARPNLLRKIKDKKLDNPKLGPKKAK